MTTQSFRVHDSRVRIGDLIENLRMSVKANGFDVVSLKLVAEYMGDSGEQPTFDNLRRISLAANLSVVRVEDKVIFRKVMKPMEDMTEVLRASGDVVCDICHYPYKHHPSDASPNEFLNVLCNGRRVKL